MTANTLLTIYLAGAAATAIATWGMDKFRPRFSALQHVSGGILWPIGVPIIVILRIKMFLMRRRIRASQGRTAELLAEITGKGDRS